MYMQGGRGHCKKYTMYFSKESESAYYLLPLLKAVLLCTVQYSSIVCVCFTSHACLGKHRQQPCFFPKMSKGARVKRKRGGSPECVECDDDE